MDNATGYRFALGEVCERLGFTAYRISIELMLRGRKCSVSTVYRWFNGKTEPGGTEIALIAEALEIHPGDFFLSDTATPIADVAGQKNFTDDTEAADSGQPE